MKSLEQQLEEEKRIKQAIIDVLDEALGKVGYTDDIINGLTTLGKIDFLVRAAEQRMQREKIQVSQCTEDDEEDFEWHQIYDDHNEAKRNGEIY